MKSCSKNIFIIFLVTIGVFSCKKDSLEAEDKKLIGTWDWQYTSGGLFPTEFNPRNSGYNLILELCQKGKYKFYSDNELMEYGRLVKENGIYSFAHDGISKNNKNRRFVRGNYLNGNKILKYYNDTIDIGIAYCCDGYIALYTKRK